MLCPLSVAFFNPASEASSIRVQPITRCLCSQVVVSNPNFLPLLSICLFSLHLHELRLPEHRGVVLRGFKDGLDGRINGLRELLVGLLHVQPLSEGLEMESFIGQRA